jgi:hypothetical protein
MGLSESFSAGRIKPATRHSIPTLLGTVEAILHARPDGTSATPISDLFKGGIP